MTAAKTYRSLLIDIQSRRLILKILDVGKDGWLCASRGRIVAIRTGASTRRHTTAGNGTVGVLPRRKVRRGWQRRCIQGHSPTTSVGGILAHYPAWWMCRAPGRTGVVREHWGRGCGIHDRRRDERGSEIEPSPAILRSSKDVKAKENSNGTNKRRGDDREENEKMTGNNETQEGKGFADQKMESREQGPRIQCLTARRL